MLDFSFADYDNKRVKGTVTKKVRCLLICIRQTVKMYSFEIAEWARLPRCQGSRLMAPKYEVCCTVIGWMQEDMSKPLRQSNQNQKYHLHPGTDQGLCSKLPRKLVFQPP